MKKLIKYLDSLHLGLGLQDEIINIVRSEQPNAKLEFLLPEEQDEFECAVNGKKWKSLIWDFDQWLRDQYKYCNKEYCYDIRQKLNKMICEEGLNLD